MTPKQQQELLDAWQKTCTKCPSCKRTKSISHFINKNKQMLDICLYCTQKREWNRLAKVSKNAAARRKRLKQEGRYLTVAQIQEQALAKMRQQADSATSPAHPTAPSSPVASPAQPL